MNTKFLLPPQLGCVRNGGRRVVLGWVGSMCIICLFSPLAGVRQLHFILLGNGVILIIWGKRGKGTLTRPSLIPQLNSFSPPGATAFQNTHKNFLFFSSQTLPSNLTSRRRKMYIHHPQPNGPLTK